jgi:hypothetical protein
MSTKTRPRHLGLVVMGDILPPIPVTQALTAATLGQTLDQFLRPERARTWASLPAFGVTAGQKCRSYSTSPRRARRWDLAGNGSLPCGPKRSQDRRSGGNLRWVDR